MDTRLYILAGTFAFLVVSLLYLLIAVVRARRAALAPPPQAPVDWPMLNPAPPELEAAARGSSTFAEPVGGISAVLKTPLRTGQWRPESTAEPLPRTSTVDDYWDTLIDEDALLVRPSGAGRRVVEDFPASTVFAGPVEPEIAKTPAAAQEPVVAPISVPAVAEAEDIEPVVAAETTDESPVEIGEAVPDTLMGGVSSPQEPSRSTAEWIDDIVSEFEDEAPVPTPAKRPPVVPSPVEPVEAPVVVEAVSVVPSASEPAEAPALRTTEPVLPAEPAPATPSPVPATPPPAPAEPASAEPAPPVTQPPSVPVVPVQTEASSPAPMPVVAPRPSATETVRRRPSQERPAAVAHSVTEELNIATTVDSTLPTSVDTEVAVPPAVLDAAPTGPSAVPEHELVAPVEMWFGDVRIGVRKGSRTYARFQKIAAVLFDDLNRARSAS